MPADGAEGPDGGRRPAVDSTTAGTGGADVTEGGVDGCVCCCVGVGCPNVLAVATEVSSCAKAPLQILEDCMSVHPADQHMSQQVLCFDKQ